MAERTCSIPDCPNPEKARGWCRKHYTQWYRNGDPLHGEGKLPAMTGGVYSITCLANGWVYIGSSGRVRSRISDHKAKLRRGTHNLPLLQADWDRHSEEAFVFDLVTIANDNDERFVKEQEHITAAIATGKCYNLSPTVDGTGYRLTAKQAARLSGALTGKPKSPEHRANLWRDREVTDEFREQMRLNGQMGRDKPKSEQHRRKIGEAQQGSANHAAKLTEDKVREIKRRLAAGEPGRTLAREFEVCEPVISEIKHGRSWRHIT